MNKIKYWYIFPVVGALLLALAIGVVAYSPSLAASTNLRILTDDGDSADGVLLPGGFREFGRRGHFGPGFSFDYDAFIAEELGVTVDELQAARQAAQEAALDQAVEEGLLTQEEADLINARQALRQYIDPDELISQALGIDLSELEAAREAGEDLHDLLGDLDPEQFRESLQNAYAEKIEQAVADGVISDTQAEQLQAEGFGLRGFGRHGHGGRGSGMLPFQKPAPSMGDDTGI